MTENRLLFSAAVITTDINSKHFINKHETCRLTLFRDTFIKKINVCLKKSDCSI